MPKNISWRKLVSKFRSLGFVGPFSGGRHLFMKKAELKVRIPNPHRGDISRTHFKTYRNPKIRGIRGKKGADEGGVSGYSDRG